MLQVKKNKRKKKKKDKKQENLWDQKLGGYVYNHVGLCHKSHFRILRVQKHFYSNGNLREVAHFRKANNASVPYSH